MDATARLPDIPDQQPIWNNAEGSAHEWELHGLASRLERAAARASKANAQAG